MIRFGAVVAGHGARAVTRGRARAAMLAGMRSCSRCATRLSPLARIDARFCSTRCRVAAHRAKPKVILPDELVEQDRWIRYTARKVPMTVTGYPASSTNSRTWATYAEAECSSVGVGPGFVLNGDGIVCIDLDHCLVDGRLVPWAAELLEAVPATYIETSPSGDGLHIWGRATGFSGGRRFAWRDGMVEMYATERYLTVTSRPYVGSARRLGDLSNVIAWLEEGR
jgi:primase-polymerase (primpol)-like protein